MTICNRLKSPTKFGLCLLLLLFVGGGLAMAQNSTPKVDKNSVARVVTGVVLDGQGATLEGATVMIKGTTIGVMTNEEGRYLISIPANVKQPVILVFSYVGMTAFEVQLGENDVLDVHLKDENVLGEIVVQGAYGVVQKRSDMVGSAFQVNSEKLKNLPAARVDKLLDGMMPGLRITPNTDSPGSPRTRYNIRVRGNASLSASNEPLWIVDGTPVYQGTGTNQIPGMSYTVSPLSFLNADDIESVTLLKDASATSIYGSDGANGVILVTTKKGKAGETRVNASLKYGVSAIDNSTKFKVLNAAQYMELAQEAWKNSGQSMDIFPFQDNEMNSYSQTDTDWYDVYYGVGNDLTANVSVSGGSERSSSYLSAGYYKKNGTVKGNTQERYSIRANNSYKFLKRLEFKSNLSFSYNKNDLFALSHEYYETLPIYTPYEKDGFTERLYNMYIDGYNPDGTPKWVKAKFFDNSVPDRDLSDNCQTSSETNINASLIYKVLDGLTFTAQYGAAFTSSHEDMYSGKNTLDGLVDGQPKGYSRRANANYRNWNNVERLNFERDFNKFHVTALAGLELKNQYYNTAYATGYGFMNDHIKEIGYADSDSRRGYSSSSQSRKLSYFGEAAVSYDHRYYFTVSYRRDGTSSFGKFTQWKDYFSVGASWNIHNEEFYNCDLVNVLKLKATFGSNGNSRIDGSSATGTYTFGDSSSYGGQTGATMGTPANPGLSWETTYMTNIGLRAVVANRVDIELEGYYNKTVDLLSKIYTSRTIGDERLYSNVGELSNKGLELNIESTNLKIGDFAWRTELNISHNKNKIEKLYNGNSTGFGTTIWTEGADSDSFYLVKWAGVDPATGKPMWYDLNGNITFTYSDSNRVVDKTSNPKLYGGMTNTFQYGPFALSFMLNYTIGGYALCTYAGRALADGYGITESNESVNSLERWQQPGDLSINPINSTISSHSVMYSTRHLYHKTNIRLQNVAVSYRLPKRLCEKAMLRGATVTFIGDDLYLWTPDQDKHKNSYKTMMNGYPVERTFSLSLSVDF